MRRYNPPANKKPVHLVKHLKDIPENKRIFPCIGDIKYDGVYAYCIIRPGDYRVFSRTGIEYLSLQHISNGCRFIHNELPGDWVLIFEVYNDVLPINTISGYCRDTKNQWTNLYCRVHDIIPYEDFDDGVCNIPYIQRRARVRRVCQQNNLFVESESFHILNETKAQEFAEKFISEGHEGIIGRDPNGVWMAGKKNEAAWKIKQEESFDLEVVGMLEGTGKYLNTLGTLLVKFRLFGKSDGELVELPISGMTDAQRDTWWKREEEIIGSIVRVDAMQINAYGMLREPRFKEVRKDKIKADF